MELIQGSSDGTKDSTAVFRVGQDYLNINPVEIINKGNLPSYNKTIVLPKEFWKISGQEFVKVIENSYDEIIKWKKNLFKIPSGKAAKDFIKELTHWLDQ